MCVTNKIIAIYVIRLAAPPLYPSCQLDWCWLRLYRFLPRTFICWVYGFYEGVYIWDQVCSWPHGNSAKIKYNVSQNVKKKLQLSSYVWRSRLCSALQEFRSSCRFALKRIVYRPTLNTWTRRIVFGCGELSQVHFHATTLLYGPYIITESSGSGVSICLCKYCQVYVCMHE